jgi:hypothetical protein
VGGLVVEKAFDDDGRLTHVRLRGPWGEEALSLLPDGSQVTAEPSQRASPEVDAGRECPVEVHLGLAVEPPGLERAVIDEGHLHGLLQLVDPVRSEEDAGEVRLDELGA